MPYISRKKILASNSGGVSSATDARITTLEDNEYKITYFASISSSTGTITIPTGATILLDQFFGGVDAYVCTIQNGQPTGLFPQTSGGVTVDVSSFDALGNYTLSGTPSSYPVALIYILKIKAKDYSNLTISNVLDLEDVNVNSATWGNINGTLSSQTDLQNALNAKTDKTSSLVSGGAITIGDYDAGGTNNDVRVAIATWYIVGYGNYSTVANTDFLNIALSSAGLQRYIGFYGTTSNTITKVEGTESEYAAVPTQPANTALIGYILVTDSAAGTAPDLSPYALINPRVLSITSSAAPTYDISQYDELYITALAADVNLSTNMSGTVGHSKQFIIHIKDNTVARLITMGTKFAAKYAALPTTTTAGKWMSIGCKWNSNTSKFDVWVVSQEA
jgi:hypothetical protein